MTKAPRAILTVNGGSSSIKFALFGHLPDLPIITSGQVEGLNTPSGTLHAEIDDRPTEVQLARPTHADGTTAIVSWLRAHVDRMPIAAIAHRIVHGGDAFWQPTWVTTEVLDTIRTLVPLAPNHLPDEIVLVETFARAMPGVPHLATFDTAFHHALPDVARTVPLPGVRRFGFHGLSYTFLMSELERLAGPVVAHGRVILAHLGSGASLAAVCNGRSVDTTMGMTPTGGILMSTRSGDLDPGALTYLMRRDHMTADEVDALVTHRSGLLNVSGVSGDMKTLLDAEASDTRAALAVQMFCYQTAKAIGALTVALGGLDTLVFSAGIGERAPSIRQRVCGHLAVLGVAIGDAANAANAPIISSGTSCVSVRVIPTNEALVMARLARNVLDTAPGAHELSRSPDER